MTDYLQKDLFSPKYDYFWAEKILEELKLKSYAYGFLKAFLHLTDKKILTFLRTGDSRWHLFKYSCKSLEKEAKKRGLGRKFELLPEEIVKDLIR